MPSTLSLLQDALGEAVSVDPDRLRAARSDKSGHLAPGTPLAVITARSVDDVREVMRIASRTHTPVVTRGGGTGLAGGAIASDGEIVLSTLAMNRVLEVSPDDAVAVVEPGIINAELNAQLEAAGLWFAPDPASRDTCTVGGNIATNAGGLLCAKYGVTRDAVLGLKVVLADGTLLELGHRTIKGVTGLDLTALMIGSEGTLGVIVQATLRLRPRVAGPVPTISASFLSVQTAAACSAAIGSRFTPAIMELIGESAMAGIAEHLGIGHPGGSQLILQFDGAGAQAQAEEALALVRAGGGEALLSIDPIESERLFATRRAFHPAMAVRGTVLIEDVCVPRSKLAPMFAEIAAIEQRFGIEIPTVAHAGDGNLHPNFVFEGPDVPEQIWQAADELFLAALRLGGTLTGEHGIGLLKRRWLKQELGEDQFELQKRIKAV
ncbi:MAG: FAD-binding protein, partial [Salinibacterium sp.]